MTIQEFKHALGSCGFEIANLNPNSNRNPNPPRPSVYSSRSSPNDATRGLSTAGFLTCEPSSRDMSPCVCYLQSICLSNNRGPLHLNNHGSIPVRSPVRCMCQATTCKYIDPSSQRGVRCTLCSGNARGSSSASSRRIRYEDRNRKRGL